MEPSTTVELRIYADDYPELFKGVEASEAYLRVECAGYLEPAPYCGEFEIRGAESVGPIDADAALEAVGRDVVGEKWLEDMKGDRR